MILVFVTEARFIKDAEGTIYGDASYNQDLWKRYLNVFKEIYVVARVFADHSFQGDRKCISSMDCVHFVELPYFIGFTQYFIKRRQLKQIAKQVAHEHKFDCFICRVPGIIGKLVIPELNKIHKPYALEVVGDPWDVFAHGGISHFLRPIIRIKDTLELKHHVRTAWAVLYVTKTTLQKRYTAGEAKYTTYASNVKLEKSLENSFPKTLKKKDVYQIVSVGSLSQMYKSPDIVLRAIKQLNDRGIICQLTWFGGGMYRGPMQEMAKDLGIDQQVCFKGDVNNEEVRSGLLESDLFVLASKTEGLPRAMIEAMASGLPCIGTKVGGIPELLEEEVMVPKGNVEKLALKMHEILLDKDFYKRQAARNLEEAKNYSEAILSGRRNQFYNYIVDHL